MKMGLSTESRDRPDKSEVPDSVAEAGLDVLAKVGYRTEWQDVDDLAALKLAFVAMLRAWGYRSPEPDEHSSTS